MRPERKSDLQGFHRLTTRTRAGCDNQMSRASVTKSSMKHVLSSHVVVNHRLSTVWLDKVWNAGVPAVEIFCAKQHLDYTNKAQINELGHWFRDAQLKLHSLHSPMYT